MADTASQEARQAGRGVVFIAFAKLYFMVAGAVIEISLPTILSSVGFGAYRLVVYTVSPLNNVLITGTIQTVARFTAQSPDRARAVQRGGFRVALTIGLPLAIGYVAVAYLGLFAWGFKDADKTGPIMLAGAIVAGYALYAVFVGTANGLKQFHKQAGLDITMATLRAIGIVGLTTAGFGLYGAITGWVAATAIILVVASFVVGLPGRLKPDEESVAVRPMASFFGRVAIYLLFLNLIMVVDTYLLKSLSTNWFSAHRPEMLDAVRRFQPSWAHPVVDTIKSSQLADSQVGYYGAVQTLARLSYQLIIAATFVIFPLISRTTFASDEHATKRYITTTLRYSLIFAAAIGFVLAANPHAILDLPYPADYARNGGLALVALGLGSVAFAIFAIVGTILNGAGLTTQAIIVAVVTLVITATANAIVIPRFEPGSELLFACGLATGASMVIGCLLGGWFLRKHLGAFLPLLTVLRVAIAGAVAMAIGYVIPFSSKLMTLVEACVVGVAFIAVLVATRELTRADLSAVLGVASRKGKS